MKKATRSETYTKAESIDWKAVGRRIRELRGFDMTQEEFGHKIEVSQNYLSLMEQGQAKFGVEILFRISQECGRSMEWLVTGEE